jgi:hypothetical protein
VLLLGGRASVIAKRHAAVQRRSTVSCGNPVDPEQHLAKAASVKLAEGNFKAAV